MVFHRMYSCNHAPHQAIGNGASILACSFHLSISIGREQYLLRFGDVSGYDKRKTPLLQRDIIQQLHKKTYNDWGGVLVIISAFI
jgi:hypothetical protein